MILYPAIDLKDGACVRLRAGRMEDATLYSRDPAAQSQSFLEAGFDWLHVVDLDGAFAGTGRNRAAIEAILRATRAQIQLGGGLRDLAALEGWLAMGVARLVLGTAAVRDPEFAKSACARFPGRIAIGIDARDGKVALRGWEKLSNIDAIDFAQKVGEMGVERIVYTDITRDGMLSGINLETTREIAEASGLKVTASGGVASLDDIYALKELEPYGVDSVIVGKALYEGVFTLEEALDAAESDADLDGD